MKELLEAGGLIFVDAFDGYTNGPVREESERIVMIAREQGKGGR